MIMKLFNSPKAIITLLVALAINVLLYMSMSQLSYRQPGIIENAFESAILLSMPESRPDMKEDFRKKLKKRKMPKPLEKKLAQQRSLKTPPTFDFDKPSADLGGNGLFGSGIAVSLPDFKAPNSIFEIGELDRIPQIIYRVIPIYPYAAKRKQITGRLTLQFLVNRDGRVELASVIKAVPEGIFEQSALKAVSKWRFKPGYYRGEPVSTRVVLPINFSI